MTKTSKNQKGFGAVEVVLILVIVVLVSVVGYMVYKNNHKTTTKTTNTAKTASTKSSAKTSTVELTTATIKIPELGISITVPKALSNLTYAVTAGGSAYGEDSVTVGVSTITLTNADPIQCSANNVPLITIERVDGQYPANPTVNNTPGPLVKQFSSFYIAYGRNNGQIPCYTNAKADAIASSDYQDLLVPQTNSDGAATSPKINFTVQSLN